MKITIDDQQLDRWRALLAEEQADQPWQESRTLVNTRRLNSQEKLKELLSGFLSDRIGLEEFRSTYDQKTRTEWVGFGLKGLSGAMFLNQLVKHVPDSDSLTDQLKAALPVPATAEEGMQKLSRFHAFLRDLQKSGKVGKNKPQPMRLPFFVSSWWHVQNVEDWPVFYVSARKVLKADGLYAPVKDPVQDYFAFREAFRALASGLGLDSWTFEHLCSWREKGKTGPIPPEGGKAGGKKEEDDDPVHADIQLLLAKIGRKLGCEVWIASNDHKKESGGQQLKDLSLPKLPPLGMDEDSQKLVSRIDVLWLKGKQVAAAFEIEHTTLIYSGLLRMADLVASSPNFNFPLYIVVPAKRLGKVREELSRPTFQALELHERCGFFSYEALQKETKSIMEWATDPGVIEKLASKVEDSK